MEGTTIDCVDMMHRGGAEVQKRMATMTAEQQVEYWEHRSWMLRQAVEEVKRQRAGETVFEDDDRGYRHWVESHPEGFVLNAGKISIPSYIVLHRASCHTIRGRSRGQFWTHDYIKVCSNAITELEAWARRERGKSAGACRLCKPRNG